MRILIVDDSPAIRSALRVMFGQIEGWEVCGEAENGKIAIEITPECRPDIIVLDLSMPVMNGFEAARELKHNQPSVPLIMYTTFSTPQLMNEALSAGCSAVASKADSPKMLVDKMRGLLGAAG